MNGAGQDRETLRVELGPNGYDIVVGDGVIADAGSFIGPVLAGPRAVVVTDENVAAHWLGPFAASLDGAGIEHDSIVVPAGEQTKDLAHFGELAGRLLDLRIDRQTALIALGGGVVGDLAGFAAAVTLRGVDFIQVPTTLLAQVDSSVGGKTGINTAQGKNLIGAFHQPRLVVADIATLATLPDREMRAGYAEVVKYGLIGDADFFAWLEADGPAVVRRDGPACRRAVTTSCAAKAAVVAADELERGQRALLNLGHTFGHALEAKAGYGEALLHGEAIAIGMVMAFDLSVRLGLCAAADRDRIRAHLAAVGLPTGLAGLADGSWSADGLVELMGQDKKVRQGALTFVLARAIGDAFIARDVDSEDVRAVVDDHLTP